MYRLIVFAILLRSSMAVIYSMNETEYNKMPPLFGLDDYPSCLEEEGGIYCVGDYGLVGKGPLMHMIKEYSDYKLKHYNHTQIHRGICVTKTCKTFISTNNSTRNLKKTLGVCLNDTIYKEYKLQVKLEDLNYCKRKGDPKVVDGYDIGVGIVYFVIIMINVIGTIYDECRTDKKSGNIYLLSFSIRRNWKKLVAPSGGGADPRLERLKLFHGLRTLTIIGVIFSHTVLIMAYAYVDNPLFIEKAYEDPAKQLLFNGTLIVHTFFVISSFLMAYNLELHTEKHGVSLMQWPNGVLMRWLRLTPAYGLVIATTSTWARHLGSGPLWDLVVTRESEACRQYWWAHILFINNYVYGDSQCAPQTWYLAADTQLFCFGLLLCLVFKTTKSRIFALSGVLTVGLLIVAGHTYFQDLDAVVLQSPETYRNLYEMDDTFRIVYIRGHTNLSTYCLGLAGGFLTYYWQNKKKDLSRQKNYRWLFWSVVPLGVLTIMTGWYFYVDGSTPPTIAKVLYAVFYKPVFQVLVICIIIGVIFKIETVYRTILEWRGFTWTGRVSYGAFLIHPLFQRGLVGGTPRLSYLTEYSVMMMLSATLFVSFIAGAMLFVFVEAPIGGITKAARGKRGKKKQEDDGNRA